MKLLMRDALKAKVLVEHEAAAAREQRAALQALEDAKQQVHLLQAQYDQQAQYESTYYDQRALMPLRSWPVTQTASSAGIDMQSVSQAPGRKPAAVGSGGRSATATDSYSFTAPVRPAGCRALIKLVSLSPQDLGRSGINQLGSSLTYISAPRRKMR